MYHQQNSMIRHQNLAVQHPMYWHQSRFQQIPFNHGYYPVHGVMGMGMPLQFGTSQPTIQNQLHVNLPAFDTSQPIPSQSIPLTTEERAQVLKILQDKKEAARDPINLDNRWPNCTKDLTAEEMCAKGLIQIQTQRLPTKCVGATVQFAAASSKYLLVAFL